MIIANGAHARSLRVGRYSEPNRIYLITAVTHGRARLFERLAFGRAVVNSLRFEESRERAATLAYVVMPDHLHWLMQLGDEEPLSDVVKYVKNFSAKRVNELRGSKGDRVWQPGFHDHAIRQDEEIVSVARYVVANPVRAGLVEKVSDYSLWDAIWI